MSQFDSLIIGEVAQDTNVDYDCLLYTSDAADEL